MGKYSPQQQSEYHATPIFYHSNLTFCKKNIWILISYK